MWMHNRFNFMKGRKSDSKTLRRLAQYENNRQWQDVFTRYFNILVNQFEWKGLPLTVDHMFFESLLLYDGKACIVDDQDFHAFLGLPTVAAGNMNIYYQNTFYRAYSLNYSKKFLALTRHNMDIIQDIMLLSNSEAESYPMIGCVCNDNYLGYSYVETLEIYTDKIVNAMRAIDVVQNQAKLPSIIETDEDSKNSLQQAINDIDTNVLAVYVSRDLAKKIKETKTFPTQFNPAVLDILWAHKNNLESEMLTAFGVNNLNTNDKKERLLTDEVNSNNEIIGMNAASRLDMRKHFAEDLNRIFGLNVSVELKHDFSLQEEGEKDGSDFKDTGGSSSSSGV